jgi:hypothetical protein
MMTCTVGQDGRVSYHGATNADRGQDVGIRLAPLLMSRVYFFAAERFNIGQFVFGPNSILAPNAQNLPQVLNSLQSNPHRFRELVEHVRLILPQVREVSITPIVNNEVQILIWPIEPTTRRADLAVPLSECGTGVGQVLAILYVAICSPHPQTIVIDEPQSFLHPGAARKLIEVLKSYGKHQYIVATHSPAVIAAAEPETLTLATLTDGETVLTQANPGETQTLQTCLSELGARLSDVFGADSILWVEGRTEETCFPVILEKVAKLSLMGTVILGVKHTSEFEGRESERAIEVYRKISSASQIFPVALGFIFDRECRSETKMADIVRAGPVAVKFTKRRMFENYLLNVRAIVQVMNEIQGFRPNPVTEDEIQGWIDANRASLKYYCTPLPAPTADDWLSRIDGAELLEDLFKQFSEPRVEYRKVDHGLALTVHIARDSPHDFDEIVELMKPLLTKT